ncbi:MAG: NAD kinase [Methylophilaceae bacterium]|nr:NAD kinase [Methylophilaceae bacterium]
MQSMKKAFKNVALIGKYNAPEMRDNVLAMAEFLAAEQLDVFVEEQTAKHCNIAGYQLLSMSVIGERVDLAVVLGGDGTMLAVSRQLANSDIPLIGVNQGRVGFLTDVSSANMLAEMRKIILGEFSIEQRILLTATVMRNGQVVSHGRAMNDVVVNKSGMSRLIELEVNIDGQFVHKQRSDGLILATPTGTTAYALSAGGPILHPTLDAITLVPICPHTLSNRPIAINSSSKVEITLVHAEDAAVHLDGQLQIDLMIGDKVLVERDQQTVSLLHPMGHSHYDMLRQKLNWG